MPIHSRWTEPIPNSSLQQWIFGSSSATLSDRKVFIDADRPDTHYVTLSEYRLLAKRIALGLQSRGLKPGDRVLLFSGNNVFFPSVFLGILMAGGIFTGANPGYVTRELAHQLKDSGALFMIAHEGSLHVALEAAKEVGLSTNNVFLFDSTAPDLDELEKPVAEGSRHWTELVAPRSTAERFTWIEPSDARMATCCLNYSSGTTGVPKGVEISHYNFVANIVGVVKVSSLPQDCETLARCYRSLCFLPMYHAYAQTIFIARFAKEGIPTYVMPAFDFVKVLAHIQNFRITHLTAVPPILVALTKHPATKKFDLSSLENVGCGAAPLAADVSAETERILNKPGLFVRQGWGMTEVTCSALAWDPTRRERESSVGELLPNCSARLVDSTGKDVLEGQKSAELWISGPIVMRRYWKNPKATTEAIVVDIDGTRWLRTGDIAYVDSYQPGALFHIVDRIKELIKVKGNQVAPAELEALLLERSEVADAAVIGVTIHGEEIPRAYIVLSPGSKATEKEIAEWLGNRVAKHKRLKGGVVFTDAIPRNPSGKIIRQVLRSKASEEISNWNLWISKLSHL